MTQKSKEQQPAVTGTKPEQTQTAPAAEQKQPEQPKFAAKVLRDFWPTGDQEDRVRKGQVIEVTPEELIAGLELNTLARVKPEDD